MIHYHGTPITPRDKLYELAGRHFCVSAAEPRDVRVCHEIGQSVMLDNGAYSFWRNSRIPNWPGVYDWMEPWLDYPTTWAVIPDVIDGSEEDNDVLLMQWAYRGLPKGAPVWHLHESLNRLYRLVEAYERICFGSSGAYAVVGTDQWRRRVCEAFETIADRQGRVPWIHMLRGMAVGTQYPFGSVDSTDIARNHNRNNTPRRMADRWDGTNPIPLWHRVGVQQEMESA